MIIKMTGADIEATLYPVSIHLNQTVQEEITGNGEWQDVGSNVNLIDPPPENCSYITGSINVNSAVSCTRYLRVEVDVKAKSATTAIMLSGGKNDTANEQYTSSTTLINANDEDFIAVEIPIHIDANVTETVDFKIKGDKNFYINNAKYRFGSKLTNGGS